MAIYEYRCSNDHTFEVMQRMSDDQVTSCEVCDSPVERIYHPVAIHFKGSGFHNTDYKKSKNGARGSDRTEESGKESGEKKSESSSKKSKDGGSSTSGSSSGSSEGSKQASAA